MTLAIVDWAILLAYLAATLAFGWCMGRGAANANDYLLGGRNLPWWALLLSIVATETSTATFLSVPGIAYGGGLPGTTGDLRYLQLPLGFVVGRLLAAWLLLPGYFRGELSTAYEVLQQRCGAAVRRAASAMFLLLRTLGDGLRLFLAASVLQLLLGLELWQAVAITGGVTLAYTVAGGLRAVVYTDVLQFAVYMLGAGLALALLHTALAERGHGDWLVALPEADAGRVLAFGFDLADPYTFWAGLLGGAVLSLGSHGVDQLTVQRYLAARSFGDARRALCWSGPVVLLQFALFSLLGLLLQRFYTLVPPEQPFARSDEVFAHFLIHHLPIGIKGVVLGAVLSAAMSTLSSSLSASASAFVHDFWLPWRGTTAGNTLRTARLATLVFAVLQMAVGISGLGAGDAVVNQVLGLATVTTGVLLGLFLLARLPRTTPRSAFWGLGCGLLVALALLFVLPWLGLQLAWPWRGPLCCAATVLAGWCCRSREILAA